MTSRRRLLAVVPVLGIALATSSSAAPTKVPQVKDATGDSVGSQSGTDIVSVLYTTAGPGSGRDYRPKQLAVTMRTAGPVLMQAGLTYEVEATTDTCGDVTFTFEPGTPYERVAGVNGWADWGTCSSAAGDSSVELLPVEVSGNAISWTFGLKSTPLKVGTVFRDFRARIDPSNPAVPFPSNATGTGFGLIDSATGSGTWKVG
jgi:hypothetical protein